jgi:hypothetical protein
MASDPIADLARLAEADIASFEARMREVPLPTSQAVA